MGKNPNLVGFEIHMGWRQSQGKKNNFRFFLQAPQIINGLSLRLQETQLAKSSQWDPLYIKKNENDCHLFTDRFQSFNQAVHKQLHPRELVTLQKKKVDIVNNKFEVLHLKLVSALFLHVKPDPSSKSDIFRIGQKVF